MNQHVDQILEIARNGKFGTPEKPLRNGGNRHTFWACYFGHRKPDDFKDTISYPAAKAGAIYKKELST